MSSTFLGAPPVPSAPVLIGTGYVSPIAVARTLINLLIKYGWSTVYAVVDQSSVPIYPGILRVALQVMTTEQINFYQRHIFANKMRTFLPILDEFRIVSRGEVPSNIIQSIIETIKMINLTICNGSEGVYSNK